MCAHYHLCLSTCVHIQYLKTQGIQLLSVSLQISKCIWYAVS